jgi:hypothetical protein
MVKLSDNSSLRTILELRFSLDLTNDRSKNIERIEAKAKVVKIAIFNLSPINVVCFKLTNTPKSDPQPGHSIFFLL